METRICWESVDNRNPWLLCCWGSLSLCEKMDFGSCFRLIKETNPATSFPCLSAHHSFTDSDSILCHVDYFFWSQFSLESESIIFFVFSRAAPTAHGGSHARRPIGTVAAGLHHSHSHSHSHVGSEPHLQPIPQLMVTPDP